MVLGWFWAVSGGLGVALDGVGVVLGWLLLVVQYIAIPCAWLLGLLGAGEPISTSLEKSSDFRKYINL